MTLTANQQLQEDDYLYPYHWAKTRENVKGRLFFGYLDLCLSFIDKKNFRSRTFLDAGCGDARLLGLLREAGVPPENLFGADYSEKAIGFAQLILPGVHFQVADLTEQAPGEKDFFDYVFLVETLEHIELHKVSSVLGHLRHVLKPEGELIITVPSDFTQPTPGSKHYQHFSIASLRAALSPHFSQIEITGQDKTGFHLLKILYRLIDNNLWQIKPLAEYYNLNVWPKYFNGCSPEHARRLIARCKK